MKAFIHEQLPSRVVFGAGRLDALPAEADHLGADSVLLITSAAAKTAADRAGAMLGARLRITITEVPPHVPVEQVEQARFSARRAQADCVVTIGGGSSIGLGKAIALEQDVALLAIPTTYSGSEMTPIFGITAGQRKETGRDLRVLPRTVIYDPALTTSLPPEVTGASGMNALAHSMEALYSQDANPVSSMLAEESIKALARGLPVAVRTPEDMEGRSVSLYGAYLAGAAMAVTGVALHHTICHVLGGTFGLAHADANAVMLPHVARFNSGHAPEAMERMAWALGAAGAPNGLFDLARRLGAPRALSDLGMAEDDLEEAARLATQALSYNPRPSTEADVLQILRDAHAGRHPSEVVSS
ncbi:MAG: maleylacetate reductase [Actinobacteria bacterium]|nr:maleylacetate reductase [Actinomycetota bacterium]